MPVKVCNTDGEFRAAMAAAGAKPVVVDFTASWCGPCKQIAPVFDSLSNKYPTMDFLKVDVDKCEETASSNGISAMPTFLVFLNGAKVDQMRGANAEGLETMIKKWADTQPAGNVPGQTELKSMLDRKQMELLNGDDDTPLEALMDGHGNVKSDCDEQLIISLPFNQPVKVHSILIKGAGGRTPKTVRVFANLPKTLDFDTAMGIEPIQELEFGKQAQSDDGEIHQLKYVKFQNVHNLQLFVKDNQEHGEVTEIQQLKVYGTPLNAVNMTDFKRVAGKEGEVGH